MSSAHSVVAQSVCDAAIFNYSIPTLAVTVNRVHTDQWPTFSCVQPTKREVWLRNMVPAGWTETLCDHGLKTRILRILFFNNTYDFNAFSFSIRKQP